MLKRHIFAILLIAAASLIVYSSTFNASFHFDDVYLIVDNPKIKDLKYLPELLGSPRGLAIATFSLNYAVGGLNVFGYHLVNIVIHIANGILVYFLLFFTLSLTNNPLQNSLSKSRVEITEGWPARIAVFTALIFAVHPIQTQAVTYIAQRMESLSSLFYLMALFLFITGATARRHFTSVLLYCGVLMSYFMGFKSKEIVITLPAIILLYDLYFINSLNLKGLLKRWPLYLSLLIISLYMVSKTMVGTDAVNVLQGTAFNDVSDATAGFGVKDITPGQYLLTQFKVIMTYLRLLIVPVNQNLDYDYAVSTSLFELPTLLSFIAVTSMISAGFYLCVKPLSSITRHGRIVSFFIFWFFVILSPTSSFIPIQDVIFEHRLYLPSVGIIAIFVILFDEFVNKPGRFSNRGLN